MYKQFPFRMYETDSSYTPISTEYTSILITVFQLDAGTNEEYTQLGQSQAYDTWRQVLPDWYKASGLNIEDRDTGNLAQMFGPEMIHLTPRWYGQNKYYIFFNDSGSYITAHYQNTTFRDITLYRFDGVNCGGWPNNYWIGMNSCPQSSYGFSLGWLALSDLSDDVLTTSSYYGSCWLNSFNPQNFSIYLTMTNHQVSQNFCNWYNSLKMSAYDPYAPGGTSEPGGGDGTFDWESDSVPIAPLPSIGAMNSGFINLYMPTLAELQNLARYMWAGAFDIDSLKKIVADPMDIILGLSILPITQDEAEATDGSILIGNLDSQIPCKVAQKQFIKVDCGTIEILAKWGAYLDFSPHSKLQLYLPYIGFVSISPDDCMNGTIHVVYNIDILSGACLAQVHCTSPGKNVDEIYDHVLYEFTGNCATECPVTSGQYRNILSSLFNVASGAAASGASGNLEPLIESSVEAVKDTFKPQVYRSGGPGKNTGMLGHQAPYLVLTCPRMIIPGDQNRMIGYPSYVTLNLGDLTGYTQIDTIHLSGIPASDNEQNEIIQLLHEGVYL